jgi:signal transduction histidine kinase
MGGRLYVCGYTVKPGKLYIRIFVSFVLILIVTEILIFGLFMVFAGRSFRSRLEQYTKAKVLMVKEVVEDKIRAAPTTNLAKNEQLREFIYNFGQILGAKVWVQKTDGTLAAKYFQGVIPERVGELKKRRSRHYGNFELYNRRHSDFYAVIPTGLPEEGEGSIHILFDTQGPPHPEGGFALGLAVIGIVIALLIIPVSRFITKRVNQLRKSALRIAEGDLSHRVPTKGKDEIGELARAFNRMTDKLERMIMSSKELTANVSHELRTPLTRIRIAEELLRERWQQGDSRELERHLDAIREDIEELDCLIGRILELSKLDIHESPLTFGPLNPSDLLNDLLERLRPVMERKGLHVRTDLSFHPPFEGDRDALYTALLNILDNAAKFTPENGDIMVRMQSEKGFLEIGITNAFQKLAEEDLSRIFDPFHRAERSWESGSGLGLAITKKIVERHGGHIQAFNSPEGLEIRMRLPAKPSKV